MVGGDWVILFVLLKSYNKLNYIICMQCVGLEMWSIQFPYSKCPWKKCWFVFDIHEWMNENACMEMYINIMGDYV